MVDLVSDRSGDLALAVGNIKGIERSLEAGKARLSGRLGYRIGEIRGWRSGTLAIQKTEASVEADLLDEPHRLLKIGVRFARKSHNEVGGDR